MLSLLYTCIPVTCIWYLCDTCYRFIYIYHSQEYNSKFMLPASYKIHAPIRICFIHIHRQGLRAQTHISRTSLRHQSMKVECQTTIITKKRVISVQLKWVHISPDANTSYVTCYRYQYNKQWNNRVLDIHYYHTSVYIWYVYALVIICRPPLNR